MAIKFEKQSYSGDNPAIWRGECKVLPGGFKPKQNFATGTVIKRATPVQVNFEDMSVNIVKVGKVLTGSTTTKLRLTKNSYLAVGDTIAKIGVNSKSTTVSAIDTSNPEYDEVTIAASLSTSVGDLIQESAAYVASTTDADPLYQPNAIIAADYEYTGNGIPTLDVAYEALVLSNVAQPIPSDYLVGFSLKNNPSIKYIRQ